MESADTGGSHEAEADLREQAIERIKRKRKFRRDVLTYVLVNAGLWVIWAADGAKTDDLWPAWVRRHGIVPRVRCVQDLR